MDFVWETGRILPWKWRNHLVNMEVEVPPPLYFLEVQVVETKGPSRLATAGEFPRPEGSYSKGPCHPFPCCTLRILGPSLEGVEPSITRVCTLKTLVFEGADP